MKKQVWGYLLVAILLMVGVYFVGRLSTKAERDRSAQNLIAIQDTVQHYKIVADGLELQVAEKKALILTKDEAIKLGFIEKEYWRKLHMTALVANVKLEAELKATQDSLALPDDVQIITIRDTAGINRDYVKIPFTLLDINSEYLSLNAGMKADRTAYYALKIPIVGTITIGYKGKTAIGVFSSPNPYLNVTNMNIVISPYKHKWYEKWYFPAIGGLIVGFGINSLIK